MTTLRLVELAPEPWAERWTALRGHLAPLGIDLQVKQEVLTVPQVEGEIQKFLSDLKNTDALVVHKDLAELALKVSKVKVKESEQIGSSLLFLKSEDKLWPSTLFTKAIVESMSETFGKLDFFAPVLVAGSNVLTDHIVFALSKAGFTKIFLTDEDLEGVQSRVLRLKQKLFNIQISALPVSQIATQPGVFGLLVNTSDLHLENHLLDELYFFNFLASGSAVLDITLVPVTTPLLKQAQDWGARAMSGTSVWAAFDRLMVEALLELYSVPQVHLQDYSAAFAKIASAVPFDVDPYLKRFLERF